MSTGLNPPPGYLGAVRSISDDDLCATCRRCVYNPGELSGCLEAWPGVSNPDGYVIDCGRYAEAGR